MVTYGIQLANLDSVTAKKNLPERQNHNHTEYTDVVKVIILVVKFKFVLRISIPKNLSVKIQILALLSQDEKTRINFWANYPSKIYKLPLSISIQKTRINVAKDIM